MKEPETVALANLPSVASPEELRVFLNGGAIYDLAYRLELANKAEPDFPFSILGDGGEFTVYWLHQARKRLLIIQNSLSRLPGLFLKLPVESDEYKVAIGEISASYTPSNNIRRVPEPYSEGMVIVGSPQAVVKTMVVAGQELSLAAGIVTPEDI
jgi:hypothetical protein